MALWRFATDLREKVAGGASDSREVDEEEDPSSELEESDDRTMGLLFRFLLSFVKVDCEDPEVPES